MSEEFFRKKGDREEPITVILKDDSGAVNLTGATVKFTMSNATSGAVKVSQGACTIATQTGATIGQVTYSWGATDTDTVGRYYAEFRVTFGDGKKATFPSNEDVYIIINIQPTLE